MANGIPYGNAFLVGTPALDRLGERILLEERQRDQQRQREMQDLDGMVNREVGKMRSADTADFIRKYQEYKDMRIQGMRDKKIQKDPILLNKLNQDANIKLAEAMQMAQQSAELKDLYKSLATQRAKDPNAFQDDFLDRYNAAVNTPISALKNHSKYGDLSDLNTFAYKGGNTDFSKQFKAAEGTPRELTEIFVGVDPNDKFKNIYKSYKGANNPFDYYNTLVGGVYGSQRARDFSIQNKYTPEQEAQIEAQFNKLINDPNYKKIYGLTNQEFPASAYNTELGRTARLKAMEYAINNPPTEKPVVKSNTEAITADRQKFAKEQQQRSYNNSVNKMYLYFNLLEASDANITAKAEELYKNNQESRDPKTGEVPTNNETKEAIFGKTGGIMIIDDNGDYIRATKDADGKITPTGEKVSKEEAIIRIRGNIKNNLPKKVKPGGSTTPSNKKRDPKKNPLGLDL